MSRHEVNLEREREKSIPIPFTLSRYLSFNRYRATAYYNVDVLPKHTYSSWPKCNAKKLGTGPGDEATGHIHTPVACMYPAGTTCRMFTFHVRL